jgi:hypothetical protein
VENQTVNKHAQYCIVDIDGNGMTIIVTFGCFVQFFDVGDVCSVVLFNSLTWKVSVRLFCCVSYVASFSGLFLFCLSSSFLLYIVVSNTYCVVFLFVYSGV